MNHNQVSFVFDDVEADISCMESGFVRQRDPLVRGNNSSSHKKKKLFCSKDFLRDRFKVLDMEFYAIWSMFRIQEILGKPNA